MSGRHRTDEPQNQSDSESDVVDDEHVAASRAGGEGGGSYVGEQSSDDDFDAGQTGAEARAQD